MLEREFENVCIEEMATANKNKAYYPIETEETQDGFPDAIEVDKNLSKCGFLEFKVSDERGKIKFRKSQPIFYKKNYFLNIDIVAFDSRDGSVHRFPVSSLFDTKDKHFLNLENRTVQL